MLVGWWLAKGKGKKISSKEREELARVWEDSPPSCWWPIMGRRWNWLPGQTETSKDDYSKLKLSYFPKQTNFSLLRRGFSRGQRKRKEGGLPKVGIGLREMTQWFWFHSWPELLDWELTACAGSRLLRDNTYIRSLHFQLGRLQLERGALSHFSLGIIFGICWEICVSGEFWRGDRAYKTQPLTSSFLGLNLISGCKYFCLYRK